MNTERNYQTNAIYKIGKFIMRIRFLWLQEILNEIVFYADSTQNKIMKYSTMKYFLISKGGSPAVRIDMV